MNKYNKHTWNYNNFKKLYADLLSLAYKFHFLIISMGKLDGLDGREQTIYKTCKEYACKVSRQIC